MESGVSAEAASPEKIIDYYNTKLFSDQLRGMFAETILLVEGATEYFALPVYLKRIDFSLAEHGIEIIDCSGKESIPLFWRLFSAYGYNCYFIFDGDGKTDANTKTFNRIINGTFWETSADKYVMTSRYAYFDQNFEKYFRATMSEYGLMEQRVAELYHVTSKPGKAKAIAQHCEEIPNFFIKLKEELEAIENLS